MIEQNQEIVSSSTQQTIDLGRLLGNSLTGGEIIALIGTLGSGKTHFIKGIALGLAARPDQPVTSPTFTLINEYQGRFRLYHIDAFRLENSLQLEALGFDELCRGSNIIVVEWADRVWPLIREYSPICIYLAHRSENERTIRLENPPEYIKNCLSRL